MLRVLVADDEPLITAGIATVLESAGDIEVVATAADGHTAVTQALRHRPDVVLLDITMPVLDGLAALGELRRQVPAVKAVMLTSFGTEPNVLAALHDGAAGFVLKHCAPDELIRAVRAAHTGDAYLSPEVTRLVLDMVTPAAGRRQRAGERLAVLGERETEIAGLVAQGLSNAEIGRRVHMSEPTIKTYVSRVLSKLGCVNRVEVALLVRDAG
ncbi:response regulator [Actinophytocola oryzae]|uniref:LuxR family two component transcriptional regulator n=1 Tax=Actinophytocola oryzae TaxID=502181 RepID=A0A4R7V2S2_9PSEU|nr:response regulator transcription factor [Actinophytocola oryzae]TDV43609.1 LuxR family two component transcriptional regulator [Actinophytocola oryzae]